MFSDGLWCGEAMSEAACHLEGQWSATRRFGSKKRISVASSALRRMSSKA
ncbi:MAG: hypothetical protein FWF12_12430 [Betaproteobacteria bacterium]|nr:hypothetical protein [Betaproteobacteria bacterium]